MQTSVLNIYNNGAVYLAMSNKLLTHTHTHTHNI